MSFFLFKIDLFAYRWFGIFRIVSTMLDDCSRAVFGWRNFNWTEMTEICVYHLKNPIQLCEQFATEHYRCLETEHTYTRSLAESTWNAWLTHCRFECAFMAECCSHGAWKFASEFRILIGMPHVLYQRAYKSRLMWERSKGVAPLPLYYKARWNEAIVDTFLSSYTH